MSVSFFPVDDRTDIAAELLCGLLLQEAQIKPPLAKMVARGSSPSRKWVVADLQFQSLYGKQPSEFLIAQAINEE
jgi:hypothetical protein